MSYCWPLDDNIRAQLVAEDSAIRDVSLKIGGEIISNLYLV